MNVNKRIVIFIGIFGGLTLLLGGVVSVLAVTSINKLRGEIGVERQEIERRYTLRRHTRSTLKTLSEMRPKVENLSRVGVREGKELDFVRALEAAAAASGVEPEIQLETANQRDISAFNREIPLKIIVEGDYGRIINYLARLEALPYYIIIKQLDFGVSRQRERAKYGEAEIHVYGTVLWFSNGQPAFMPNSSDVNAEKEAAATRPDAPTVDPIQPADATKK